MGDVTGVVFDIQRFSLHDGPGIRTTVFMKGCPLGCVWCHNPESRERTPEIASYPSKCIGCGACVSACPHGAQMMGNEADGGARIFNRAACVRCGACARACPALSLAVIGKEMAVDEVISEVMKDEVFYRNSGGMTLSGGEPLYQPEFTLALLAAAKLSGLHTCVETSGAADYEIIERCAAYTDIFLYDIKETDPERHRAVAGVSNKLIIQNLENLDKTGASVILRCPIIPGLNDRDDHFMAVGALAERLFNVTGVDVMPYHPLGLSKAEAIGKPILHNDPALPPKEKTAEWAAKIQNYTSKPVTVL